MFFASYIDIDREPLLRELLGEGLRVVDCRWVAEPVPGATDEGIGDIRPPRSLSTTRGAGLPGPLLVPGEGADPTLIGPIILDIREDDGKVLLGDWYGSAFIAVDDRDRRAPVPLS